MAQANSREPSQSSKVSLRTEVKRLLDATLKRRWPGFEKDPPDRETLAAWLDDWETLAKEVGLSRFGEGVKRTWNYCDFFPKPKNIRELLPPPKLDTAEEWSKELRELQARKRAGEKFYSLADVLLAVAEQINTGKIKPSNTTWNQWAKGFSGSTAKKKATAEKLAEKITSAK